MAKKYIMIEK